MSVVVVGGGDIWAFDVDHERATMTVMIAMVIRETLIKYDHHPYQNHNSSSDNRINNNNCKTTATTKNNNNNNRSSNKNNNETEKNK